MSDLPRLLVLSTIAITLLSGCGKSILRNPTPAPDIELTKVVGTLVSLRSKLEAVAPTLTAFAEVPKQTVEADVLPSATLPNTPTPSPEPSPIVTLLSIATQPTESVTTLQPSQTSTVTSTPQAEKTFTGTSLPTTNALILFQDDFSTKSGWFQGENSQYSLGYTQGGYRMVAKIAKRPIWSIRGKDYEDVQVEVETIHMAGPEDGYFGLVCRHKGSSKYYFLTISPDGQAEIAKVKDFQVEILANATIPTMPSPQDIYKLRADCVGSTLTLFLNSKSVVTATDSEYNSGGVGLVVGARTDGGTDMLFDNFWVLSPLAQNQ